MRMVLTCWGVVDGSEDFEVEEDEQVGVVVHVFIQNRPTWVWLNLIENDRTIRVWERSGGGLWDGEAV